MNLFQIIPNEYRDSLYLMKLSNDVSHWSGVQRAMVVMGTASNKSILRQTGLTSAEVEQAGADDLVVAAELNDAASEQDFLADLRRRLSEPVRAVDAGKVFSSLDAALEASPPRGVVAISTPGEFAAGLARQALEAGQHVFCFSHHVSIEDEIVLKDLAIQKGLLMMGPDCGTAILNGMGLGFANQVRRGPVGVVSASGSGLQEFITQVHHAGGGIAEAIGVGGRDMTSPVDGRMAAAAVRRLGKMPGVGVIALLAKKMSDAARKMVLAAAGESGLPVVVQTPVLPKTGWREGFYSGSTFEDCAGLALALCAQPRRLPVPRCSPDEWLEQAVAELAPSQKCLRGLFAGGSLCGETAAILEGMGIRAATNLAHPLESVSGGQHVLLDLGAEEYTAGRAHPFIDHRLRALEIEKAFYDPATAVVLLDMVLGWGCHRDPAGEVSAAIQHARSGCRESPVVITTVVGTDEDPQNLAEQCRKLEEAGVFVAASNAAAARLAGLLLVRLHAAALPVTAAASPAAFLDGEKTLVNVGLNIFEDGPRQAGAAVLPVQWHPPQQISSEMAGILDDIL